MADWTRRRMLIWSLSGILALIIVQLVLHVLVIGLVVAGTTSTEESEWLARYLNEGSNTISLLMTGALASVVYAIVKGGNTIDPGEINVDGTERLKGHLPDE